ncbi:MAG: hypothetical protein M3Q29_01575, partial [Chloroflexota bacterium]|nr:hypothetical protein [Chloroflexota bacterium]
MAATEARPGSRYIPSELPLDGRHFVGFKTWWEGGKLLKDPRDPNDPDNHASSTNPKTWGTFAQASALVEAGKADAVGLALTEELGITIID